MPQSDILYVKNFSDEIFNKHNIDSFILKASTNETKKYTTQYLKLKFSKYFIMFTDLSQYQVLIIVYMI